MVYIVTDRRTIKDYEMITDSSFVVCKYDHTKRMFNINKFNDNDIVFCLSAHRAPIGGLQFNNSDSKFKTSDKGYARKLFLQNGVPVPKTWYNINDAKLPYIARPARHTYGNNFYEVRNIQQHEKVKRIAKDTWYYSEVINVQKEYRVIVWGDEVLSSFSKKIDGMTPSEVVAFRKKHRGNATTTPAYIKEEEITEEQKQICIKAVKTLGLDYGGVDLMIDNNNNSIVCEVNSAPTIRDIFANKIILKLKEYEKTHA
jgi:glutathione synthase/RimK-type ligase-like ATP-grasp enzyme